MNAAVSGIRIDPKNGSQPSIASELLVTTWLLGKVLQRNK
jgi:hypothetical protein